MSRFFVQTFGCKLNQADSASFKAIMNSGGLVEAEAPEDAELIIINSCTVTHKADKDVRASIRRLKQLSPDAFLVVTGCYAERDAEKIKAIPGVDAVYGLTDRDRFLADLLKSDETDTDFGGFDPSVQSGERSRAFLKVQEGCNMSCTYCIVRLVRGKSRSLAAETIIERLRNLRRAGFAEVVLTGVHLGLWGHDLGFTRPGEGVLHLLRLIEAAADMPLIRLNSLEPYIISDDMLSLIADSGTFARHLHLSVQSGSEAVLTRMKRHTDVKRMTDVVNKAHALMPWCGIGADIIVGFPGETDEDFEHTCSYIGDNPFSYAHVFAFSPRPGTEAATMTGQVDPQIIKARSARLRRIVERNNLAFRQSMIGHTFPMVLLNRRTGEGMYTGLTDNFVDVGIPTDEEYQTGRLYTCRIETADADSTTGSLVV